jgi:uncharacterized protein with von Willebrand factor type A (vWA) domain
VIAIKYVVEKSPENEARYRKVTKRKSRFAVINTMDINDSFVVSSKRESELARAYAIRNDARVSIRRIDIRKYRVTKVANDN